jgi:hypothetical protein
MSFASFPKEINFANYPDSQKLNVEAGDQYIFIRTRKGHNIISSSGERFGNYLYRNCRNNVLIASHCKPIANKQFHTEGDIGICDALLYYKNS